MESPLFALAYATQLALDENPCNAIFDQDGLRIHLVECLEQGKVSQFPVSKHRRPQNKVVYCGTLLLQNARQ